MWHAAEHVRGATSGPNRPVRYHVTLHDRPRRGGVGARAREKEHHFVKHNLVLPIRKPTRVALSHRATERPEDPWLAARRRENEDYLERCRAQARVTTSHGAAEAHAPQPAPVSQDTVLETDTVIGAAASIRADDLVNTPAPPQSPPEVALDLLGD